MKTHFIEVTNNNMNWGKIMLARFSEEEWGRRSVVDTGALLHLCGWAPNNLMVFDLQTGEGAIFTTSPRMDIELNTKHQVWVCPMFQPFIKWLGTQDLSDEGLSKLPKLVDLPDAEFILYGYRRVRG